ncbi:uncharacterized protein LOC123539423 [Mercenaria mercenaria]|uniref:uncharacterized protein LOC123539423 n=1 Tax=Mercenaria mercenaria TaxID=6596 RepID=UPI00234FB03F|nr:uncharacterized protein LOC123539423 [Mercenaria mercenaria]
MAYTLYRFLLCLVCASVLRKEYVSAFLWHHSHQSCDQIHEYNVLLTKLQNHPCISDTQIWHMLEPLQSKSHTCLRELINNMAAYIQSHNSAGKDCRCSHDFARDVVHPLGNNHDHYLECLAYNSNCEYLFNYFYLRLHQTHEVSRCQPHYHVWTHLRDIRNRLGLDQQSEMILHLIQTYSNGHENVCKCHQDAKTTTTERSLVKSTLPLRVTEIHQVTTNLTNPTTIEPVVQTIPSTQSSVKITSTCQKYRSVSNIAVGEISSHPLAYLCPSGNRTSNEAFVLVNCNVGSPANWIKGLNVMENCDRIPTYTPIATFGAEYLGIHEHKGLSGIFLGCIPGGFKMAYQDCDTSATIKHIENGNGSGIDDPNTYFVIV